MSTEALESLKSDPSIDHFRTSYGETNDSVHEDELVVDELSEHELSTISLGGFFNCEIMLPSSLKTINKNYLNLQFV